MNLTENKKTLLTIGEIAKLLGITRRIIINYENNGLIQADTRGDFATGYRYYSMDTLVRIRTIRTYQNLGLSLKEIKKYLNDDADLEPVIKRLENLRAELDANIALLRERMKREESAQFVVMELPSYTVYSEVCRYNILEGRIKQLRDVAYFAITKYGTDISRRMYFSEHTLANPDELTYCASVPDRSIGEGIAYVPSVKALVCYHHGSYEELPSTRKKMLHYAEMQNVPLTGICRQFFLEGPPQHKDPKNYVTMIALPLAE